MVCRRSLQSKGWSVFSLLSLLLVVAVACGAAATPTPAPRPVGAEPQSAAPAAPVATPVPTATAVPSLIPTPASKVNPGKVTIMVGDFGSGRFDYVLVGGETGPANYGRILHGYLIATNERREMVPGIATKWGLSSDGLVWSFTIRKGVKFHDGKELTTEDVLWTLRHYFGPQAVEYTRGSQSLIAARQTDKIEQEGADKVSITSKTPVLFLGALLSEAEKNWWGIIPKREKLHDLEEEKAYDKNPIGAGIMKLVDQVPAYKMKFERFDEHYYQPKNGLPEDHAVNFKVLDLVMVSEVATRAAALRAGEADIAPVSLATRKQVEAGGGRIVFGPEAVHLDIKWNGCYDPKFRCHDKRVRQALDYAIDKNLMRDQLFGGPGVFQVKGWVSVTPSTVGYSPELDPFPFDPDKARLLLADAGYPSGNGFGKLIVNTAVSSAMPLLPESAQLAADFWRRELGLDVEVKVGDNAAQKKAQVAGEFNGQIWWRDNETRLDARAVMYSSYADPKHKARFYDDPQTYAKVRQALDELDQDKGVKLQNQLFLELRDEAYYINIGYLNIPWAVGPRITAWRPYPLALFPSALHTITLK